MEKKFFIKKASDYNMPKASGNRFRYYYLNTFVFISVAYLITKFNQNPTLIGILIALLVFILLPFSYIEYIFTENDKFTVSYKSIFFLQFLNRKRIFNYDEIAKIVATLKLDKKTDTKAIIIDLFTKFTAITFNVLEVEMKNGEKRHVNSKIYIKELLPILHFMQSKGVYIQIVYPNQKDI